MTYDLASLGWDAAFADAYGGYAELDPDLQPGRVARADRGVCTVLTSTGALRASLAGSLLTTAGRDPVELPCAGDWVVVRTWPDGRISAEAVLPRRAAVVRRTAGKDSSGQVLAANVEAVAVVEPVDPSPEPNRIERLLSLAWQSGAQPLVVLTKADLAPDPAAVARQIVDAAPGLEVLTVSAAQGTGLAPLAPLVASGRTLALLGPSGSGKSTLVNALAGVVVMGTQQVRHADGKGRHTTTHRALVPLPGGGAVLDTPGLRAVGLLDGSDGLDQAFADVAALVADCRFADCAHETEPDCAVQAALASGELSTRRWESWRKLQRELAHEARRKDARLAAEERHRWKRIQRQARGRSRP